LTYTRCIEIKVSLMRCSLAKQKCLNKSRLKVVCSEYAADDQNIFRSPKFQRHYTK